MGQPDQYSLAMLVKNSKFDCRWGNGKLVGINWCKKSSFVAFGVVDSGRSRNFCDKNFSSFCKAEYRLSALSNLLNHLPDLPPIHSLIGWHMCIFSKVVIVETDATPLYLLVGVKI